jgi:hypothetical protein
MMRVGDADPFRDGCLWFLFACVAGTQPREFPEKAEKSEQERHERV